MSILRRLIDRRGGVEETVVTDGTTGGKKGSKLARFDLIPALPMWQVAEHYGRGAEKYEDRNWEKGYAWSLSTAALKRHLTLFESGEDDDPETQSPHLAAVVFHALALMEFRETHPELDDRAKHKTEEIKRVDFVVPPSPAHTRDMLAITKATPEDPAIEYQYGAHVNPNFPRHWALRSWSEFTAGAADKHRTGRAWDGKQYVTVDK